MAYHYQIDPCSSHIELPVTYASIPLSRVFPPRLPYSQHPIYKIRKIDIMAAFISAILYLPALSDWYDTGFVTFTIFSLAASVLLCAADLYTWAQKKAAKPDEDPAWPSKRIMFGDVVMAVVLLSNFVGAVHDASWRRSYSDGTVAMLKDYSFLAMLVCSGLHAYAFWKQFMALHKKSWLASLQLPLHVSCQRCGYVLTPSSQLNPYQDAPPPQAHMSGSAPSPQDHVPQAAHRHEQQQQQQQQRFQPFHPQHLHQPPPPQPPNLHTYMGPSATLTPDSHASPPSENFEEPGQDGQMDDGLLIGPGYEGSRYEHESASAAPHVATTRGKPLEAEIVSEMPILEEPAGVVVGKKGGKRRDK